MHTAATVRAATEADVPAIARIIRRAFADDPFVSWILPNPVGREDRLESFYRRALAVTWASHSADVLTTEDLRGVAIWRPPGEWRTPPRTAGRLLLASLRSWGTPATVRAGRLLAALEKRHPIEEHWYLDALGVDPAEQRRGIGSALLAPVLERCDHEGRPAYLETQSPENVVFYRRFGFEVREELDSVPGGPRAWTMWREPRP